MAEKNSSIVSCCSVYGIDVYPRFRKCFVVLVLATVYRLHEFDT